MTNVKKILGVKEEKQTMFVNPERQSVEQVEDYAVKKAIATKELSIAGLTTNNIPKISTAGVVANSNLADASGVLTYTVSADEKFRVSASNAQLKFGLPWTGQLSGGANDNTSTGFYPHVSGGVASSNDTMIIFASGGNGFGIKHGTTLVFSINSGDGVNVGSSVAGASVKLGVDSTTQGFLPPRMTTTQKNAISSPATGLMVFDTTLGKVCVYTGAAWETMTSA